MVMPDLVKVYNLPERKYHLHPTCAGGNVEVREIHEIEFYISSVKGKYLITMRFVIEKDISSHISNSGVTV